VNLSEKMWKNIRELSFLKNYWIISLKVEHTVL
jgi:hypothetical protein